MKPALIVLTLLLALNTAEARTYRTRGLPWCGIWMEQHLGFHDRKLWIARNWVYVGRRASGPAPGVIGVQRHHVFIVNRVVGRGRVLATSGNDGNAVRTRVRSTANVIAWRWP